MIAAVRRLRINRRYESFDCQWCGDTLALGEEGALCEACEGAHHARCWEIQNGCGQTDCINAPLRQVFDLDYQSSPAPITLAPIICQVCGTVPSPETVVCVCQQIPTPVDNWPERHLSDGAYQAFLLGIVAVIVPPLLYALPYPSFRPVVWCLVMVLGIKGGWGAFRKANLAREEIAKDKTLKGLRVTTAAKALGITGIVVTSVGWLGAMSTLLKS